MSETFSVHFEALIALYCEAGRRWALKFFFFVRVETFQPDVHFGKDDSQIRPTVFLFMITKNFRPFQRQKLWLLRGKSLWRNSGRGLWRRNTKTGTGTKTKAKTKTNTHTHTDNITGGFIIERAESVTPFLEKAVTQQHKDKYKEKDKDKDTQTQWYHWIQYWQEECVIELCENYFSPLWQPTTYHNQLDQRSTICQFYSIDWCPFLYVLVAFIGYGEWWWRSIKSNGVVRWAHNAATLRCATFQRD